MDNRDIELIKWATIHNCTIFFSIAAITAAGLWFTGSWWGLVSLFLLFYIAQWGTKNNDRTDTSGNT